MKTFHTDIIIIGGGIAGLWSYHVLRARGYSVLLLEGDMLGGGQTLASQGIIHSGLKYMLAGNVSGHAKTMSAMPERWMYAHAGRGDVNISAAIVNARAQSMLLPSGIKGKLIQTLTKKSFGQKINITDVPDTIKSAGFKGKYIELNEPVFDIPSVVYALSKDQDAYIKQAQWGENFEFERAADGDISALLFKHFRIEAQAYISTAAGANVLMAAANGHDSTLKTQARPLLMGLMRNAPFDFYAHIVGMSEKPMATITTHYDKKGARIWYIGGQVAERDKDDNIHSFKKDWEIVLEKSIVSIGKTDTNYSSHWAYLPIDRHECVSGSGSESWLPDTPKIHNGGKNMFYCWPTKLAFAPVLSDMIMEQLLKNDILPRYDLADFSVLEPASIASAPWDNAKWKVLR